MNMFRIKAEGRRLFPCIKALINNLDPSSIYDIYTDFIDCGHYAWTGNEWLQTHSASSDTDSCNCEGLQQHQTYRHRDSPNSGTFWMANPISFARIKITNRTQNLNVEMVGTTK